MILKIISKDQVLKMNFKKNIKVLLINLIYLKKNQESKGKFRVGSNQHKLLDYGNELKKIIKKMFPNDISDSPIGSPIGRRIGSPIGSPTFSRKGKGLKILTTQQMLSRLPILLAQIQAGNNSNKLKNELRQLIYSLQGSKVLTKTVYNNLIKVI